MTAASFVVRVDEVFDSSLSVPRLSPQRADYEGDYDEAVRVFQSGAVTCPASLRLADLENAQQDVAVAQLTISVKLWFLGTLGMRIPDWSGGIGSYFRGRRISSAFN